MARRYLVCVLLLVGTTLGSGCHRRHLLREHRYYHRGGVPYQSVPIDSCSCGNAPDSIPVMVQSPAMPMMPMIQSPSTPIEMMPVPKAMPKASY